MKKSYNDIIEAIFYYSSLKKYDELYAIISLLDRHAIPQPVVEQLKGDLQYLFCCKEESKESYKKAATIYQRGGETKKAKGLWNAIERIETEQKRNQSP